MAYSMELRNLKLAANSTVIGNAGRLEIYASTDTLLAVFSLGSPFAPAPVNAVQSPTLPAPVTAVADGTAGWARVTTADGAAVMDLTVSTSGAQVSLDKLAIVAGAEVSVTSWTITDNNG